MSGPIITKAHLPAIDAGLIEMFACRKEQREGERKRLGKIPGGLTMQGYCSTLPTDTAEAGDALGRLKVVWKGDVFGVLFQPNK